MNIMSGGTTLVGFSLVTTNQHQTTSAGGSSSSSTTKRSALLGAPLDLEALALQMWNVELKRSISLEPMSLTLRLPLMQCHCQEEGEQKGNKKLSSSSSSSLLYIRNAVVTVRAGGVVRVVGTGAVEGILLVAEEVRRLLTRLLLSMSEGPLPSSVEAGLWASVRAAAPSLCAPPSPQSILTVDEVFTQPQVFFIRCAVHPVIQELWRLYTTVFSLFEEKERSGAVPCHRRRREEEEEDDDDANLEYRTHHHHHHSSSSSSSLSLPYGMWLDVSSDEAMSWFSDFVNATTDSHTVDEIVENFFLSNPSSSSSRFPDSAASYLRASLIAIRQRVQRSRVRRVSGSGSGGAVIQLYWLRVGSGEASPSLCVDTTVNQKEKKKGDVTENSDEIKQEVHHHHPSSSSSHSVTPDEKVHLTVGKGTVGGEGDTGGADADRNAANGNDDDDDDDGEEVTAGYDKVDCVLHSTGKCQVVAKSRHVIREVVQKEEVKMVLVVRKDLKMGTGKIAAQCAHAAVAIVEHTMEMEKYQPVLRQWRASGYPKVVLQCPDEDALMALATKAKGAQLPYYVIRDAGRTQIMAGSKTVLAVGPGPKSVVDTVTGHLKLL